MATMLKSLFILPFLFASAFSWPFNNPFSFTNGNNQSPVGEKPDFETNYLGYWEIDNPNVGVSSMHMQLLPNNKIIMFDTTNLGPSDELLPHGVICRPVPGKPGKTDCFAHAIEYDIKTSDYRPLKLLTDSWCSSGGLTPDGTLINTGGWKDGGKAIRLMAPCNGDCDWQENPVGLSSQRWYSTQEKLEDGNFILFGGRREFNYEIVQNSLKFPYKKVDLPFLKETTDPYENNLYPFVNLLPDGNVFLLANSRSIVLNPKTGKIIRELPVLPGGSRNYPASGMSALLPLKVVNGQVATNDVEVLVCGGNQANGMQLAEKGTFLPALQDCGRIKMMQPGAKWEIEMMPSRRVMGDMLLLPDGQILILNGATDGTSGWNLAKTPNLTPVLYSPNKKPGQRFKELEPTAIPRMYHATSGVIPDGSILVAGSNTNQNYILKQNEAEFPTELRVERFSPPYLDAELDPHRPIIVSTFLTQREIKYGTRFTIDAKFYDRGVKGDDVKVTLLPPPFTTHGYSQNQRLLVLEVEKYFLGSIQVVAPASGKIAPPGYYLLFVVHRGVPSEGIWVKIN